MSDSNILHRIDGPEDLKQLDLAELHILSREISTMIRETVEEVGGHYSSPLGVVDLTLALHYIYHSPHDKLVWDVGHQAYAHKIVTGRQDQFYTLRQQDGISGFLRREESDHDIMGAGHASTAISAAIGLAHARDRQGGDEKVVAIVGDGAMTGGLSYEGINNLGYQKTQMSIVLNDNHMSISASVGALSRYLMKVATNPMYNKFRDDLWLATGKMPTFPSKVIRRILKKTQEGIKGFLTPGALFEELGLRYIGPVDGHDLEEMIRVFRSVREMPSPTLVHIYTTKGRGSELAENDSVKYYSMSGKNKTVSPDEAPSFSRVVGEVATQLAHTDERIFCVTAAMGIGTGMSSFEKQFSERYVDVGIAEGHAVTYAAGMAIQGERPIVAIYSTFLQRAWDNLFHDVALQDLPVIFCLDRSGLVGPDGPTHHGVFDIALLRTVPNLIMSAPVDGNELRNLLATALTLDHPFVIRYPKGSSGVFTPDAEPELLPVGSWPVIQKGERVAILAVGPMVEEARKALPGIQKECGFTPTVINARFLKPLDTDRIQKLIGSHTALVSVEEGVLAGGFGSTVAEYLNKQQLGISLRCLGIPDRYIPHAPRLRQLEELELTAGGIQSTVAKIFKDKR